MCKIEAVIFDMDGILIDSEPLWQEAEISVFAELGIKLTTEMCIPMQGLKLEEVVKHWYSYKPWNYKSLVEVESKIIEKVNSLINEKGKPMAGLNNILEFFTDRKIKLAVASSSNMKLILSVVEKFNIKNKFDVLHSAQYEKFGKPNPAIFLTTAKKLHIKAPKCLVFEDSVNGVKAAKAAKMPTIAIPEKSAFDNSKFNIADIKIHSFLEFTNELFEQIQSRKT
jgi:sugar-phosphatase